MHMNSAPDMSRSSNIINTFHDIVKNLYYWIIEYVINIFCNFGNEPYLSERVLGHIQDFINELRKYYGNDVEMLKPIMQNQFFQLALLMNVLKIGDIESVERVRRDVFYNTSSVAEYFSSHNPNWTKENWIRLIYDLIYFIQGVEMCLSEIKDREKLDEIIKETADYISQGIIQQFKLD
ncbi:MAG: hypothetical protein ACYCWE_16520 [Eubacteriales bacterium]